eukprot:Sro87_g046100.1 n/a (786) ;mRNA; r:69863-72220
MKVENQGMLHKEKLDKVVLRVDERFDKVENELQESSFGSKAQEAHSSRSDGGGSSSRRECQPTPDNLSSKHAETADGDAANCRSANESHSLQASSIANTTDVSSISLAPLSETEERYVSLSTKLVTFSGELQRRDESVAALEMHAKEKSDSYSSRAEVLNTEIELQRQQLKKFEETTHRSEARLIEARKKLREFEMSVNRCREELVLRDERVSDIDDDLEEECLSTSVRSRLGSRRRQQKEHRDEWKKKVSEMESSLKMDKAECSKLAAKQELYEGELDRRRAVLNALRSSLSSVLESVAVERESIHSELLSRRQERDTWRKSISDLICVLETIEVESSGVERLQALPVVKQAICVRSGRIRPPRGSCRGVRDEDHSIDSETLQPHSQVAVLSETTELLGRQLQESNSQCQILAEKVEQMEFDLQRQGSQATEVEALKLDVASSESQMVMFREDQMSLRTDIYTQVDSLRKKLQALEEQYQATSKVSVSQPNDATSYKDLSARVEGLAAQFKDHGDIVAQVGALVDSIQACEVRLSLFEKQQDDTKADVSSMIEFFKTDLQSLKQLCEQAMMRKDAEFSDLICKVESLMVVSQAHGKHLEAVEREAEESSIAVHTQIQTGHLVQQMKEKYIDLAAKVDLLSSEVSESSQEREDQEHRAKDRDAMYLMQLQSVRDDFDSQQSKYQHQIQLRIYNAMVYLLQCIAKREGRPSALPVWNSREEELALQHRQTKKAGERKEGDSSTATWSQKPGLGYSMASGIIRANMLRPVMLASTMNTGAAIKKEEN